MIYLATFAVSLLFIYFGLKQNNKILKWLFFVVGLAVPCVLAGLRDITVGTDTGGYVLNYYKIAATSDSFGSYMDTIKYNYASNDLIYSFISYVFGKSGLSFHALLFLVECLIVVPIFVAIRNYASDKKSVLLGMGIFYLTLFNMSLNMVRQSLAISFIVLAFSFLPKLVTKNKKYWFLLIISILIAIGFHNTAIVSILIFILYFILNTDKIPLKGKKIVSVFVVITALASLMFYRQILTLVGASGIYPKALAYIGNYSTFNFDYLGTALNFGILVMILLGWQKKKDIFLVVLSIVNVIVALLGSFITYSQRLSYYSLFILLFLYLPKLSEVLLKKKDYRKVLYMLFCLFIFVQWIVIILINNSHETLPYVLGV